jgi:nucleotide-binding universal stress UspA family protein
VKLPSRRSRQVRGGRPGQRRILIPFTSGELDPGVLDAALRIAQAEEAILVPAYLIVVPMKFSLEAPLKSEVEVAMPFLEAVELASLRASVPVDARIERGRTPSEALERLWEVEAFDRVVVPAPRPGHPGLSDKDITWLLEHAPCETLILRPAPRNG